MTMKHIVRSFNKLNRPSRTLSGLPNHWVFGVRHAALSPSGDFVMAVHPNDAFLLQAGPAQILSLPTTAAKAAAIIPLLLDLFIQGSESPGDRPPSRPGPFAPWTWTTDDSELGAAIAEGLKQHGVANKLQSLSICSTEERDILDGAWSRTLEIMGRSPAEVFAASVMLNDMSKCHGCGLDSNSFSQQLRQCSACLTACYHSKICQRRHWEHHKPICLANRLSSDQPSTSSSPPSQAYMGPRTYYKTVACKAPDAQALLQTLKINPASSQSSSPSEPMRRLIFTGQDSPKNMDLLFGPNWRNDVRYEDHRIDILLDPPLGSPSYSLNARFDDRTLDRSPRPATNAEQRRIMKVREVQEMIRQRVGYGGQTSKADMMAILAASGLNLTGQQFIYTLATRTMDQSGRF